MTLTLRYPTDLKSRTQDQTPKLRPKVLVPKADMPNSGLEGQTPKFRSKLRTSNLELILNPKPQMTSTDSM